MTDKQFDQKIERINKTIEQLGKTVDKLAIATKNGFENNDGRFDRVDKELLSTRGDHQDMMLKLSNVAYRFELNELSKRVKILENKAGIRSV